MNVPTGPAASTGLVLSVVTASSGRVPLVLRKLEALAAQTLGSGALELVLVDNGCPDGVGDAVEARTWPFDVRVLRAERPLSAADARAWASRTARGRWLWWSDDDAVPAADAAERHLAVQRRRPGVTVGSVRFVDPALPAARAPRWTARRVGPAQLTGVNTVLVRERFLAVADRSAAAAAPVRRRGRPGRVRAAGGRRALRRRPGRLGRPRRSVAGTLPRRRGQGVRRRVQRRRHRLGVPGGGLVARRPPVGADGQTGPAGAALGRGVDRRPTSPAFRARLPAGRA